MGDVSSSNTLELGGTRRMGTLQYLSLLSNVIFRIFDSQIIDLNYISS